MQLDQSLGAGARRDGQGSISVLFGVLRGFKILKSKPTLGKKLALARAQLASISNAAHRARFGELSHLDDKERLVLQVIIQESYKQLMSIVHTIEHFQLFLSEDNIELLNRWCGHECSEVYSSGIDVALDDDRIRFGYRVRGNRCTTSIVLDDAMFIRPPFIEALRQSD